MGILYKVRKFISFVEGFRGNCLINVKGMCWYFFLLIDNIVFRRLCDLNVRVVCIIVLICCKVFYYFWFYLKFVVFYNIIRFK